MNGGHDVDTEIRGETGTRVQALGFFPNLDIFFNIDIWGGRISMLKKISRCANCHINCHIFRHFLRYFYVKVG